MLPTSRWCRTFFCGLVVWGLAVPMGRVPCWAQRRSVLEEARFRMVDREIVAAGVKDRRVIASMRSTPRHEFIPLNQRRNAYYDMALPIGASQTISTPFVVALMTEALDPQPTDKVLEIGTGSGYQAAVLSPLVGQVFTIEIVESLGRRADRTLKRLRYRNVSTKVGDGYQGWPEEAPFDKIIVTCSPEAVPPALVAQLEEGGRMVIPVGRRYQQTLYLLKKVDGKIVTETMRPTLFVPMTGSAEESRQVQPDPANPTVFNGGFEQVAGDPATPVGWHYQRQLKLISDGNAPAGENYVTFTNMEPGRGCRALQGLAVDGREVGALRISTRVCGRDIRPGQQAHQLPMFMVMFYDDRRAMLPQGILGPWRGTFDWQLEETTLQVPIRAREAILRIGLLGAVGEISFDELRIKAVKRKAAGSRR